jgi:hypothetical protein
MPVQINFVNGALLRNVRLTFVLASTYYKCYIWNIIYFCFRLLLPVPESAKHNVLSYWLHVGAQSSSSADIITVSIQCKFFCVVS